ncbi:MAG: hypothetical protein IJV43_09390 [Oscillospiraceae bacterium]|nr:hypothetical protein [Oscillospiraceae bacterium]
MAASKKSKEAAEASEAAGKPKRSRKAEEAAGAAEMTRDQVIREYLEVYHRCMLEDPKSFDAKGALSALDQISKLLGLDTPIKAADVEGNTVILTLSDEVGDRGD